MRARAVDFVTDVPRSAETDRGASQAESSPWGFFDRAARPSWTTAMLAQESPYTMKYSASSLPLLGLALPLLLLSACGSSSTGGAGEGGDGGPGASSASGTTLSCVVQLKGFEPQCQLYEATGADAARVIDQLRAGCIDQSSATAKVVDSCPTANGLGGCKTPVKVQGGADVQLSITNFEYKPTSDAGHLGTHSTPEQVKSFCAVQGASATYIPAP